MARPTTPVLNNQSNSIYTWKTSRISYWIWAGIQMCPTTSYDNPIHCEHFWFQKLSDSSWHKTSFQRIDSTVLCQLWAVWRTEHYHGNPISIDTWAKLVEDSIGLSLGWRWMLLDWGFQRVAWEQVSDDQNLRLRDERMIGIPCHDESKLTQTAHSPVVTSQYIHWKLQNTAS